MAQFFSRFRIQSSNSLSLRRTGALLESEVTAAKKHESAIPERNGEVPWRGGRKLLLRSETWPNAAKPLDVAPGYGDRYECQVAIKKSR